MKIMSLLILGLILFVILPAASSAKDLPKIAVWDLAPREVKPSYAQELTSILASEIAKFKKYEVYSQENVRTLAGWTEERMKVGCTSTQCLTALGQMDIVKLISGSVGKIGNRYSVSLSLFDTQNARAENMISEFCRSEDELIELVQHAARQLFGETIETPSREVKVPERKGLPTTFTNSIGMEFVLIPAGRFIMGSPSNERGRLENESPQHAVEISRPFYMGQYEVTNGHWRQVMGKRVNVEKGKDDPGVANDLPVTGISWTDTMDFIEGLNAKEGTTKYRLPTEAEWEYACRGGREGAYSFGNDSNGLGEYAWYGGNATGRLHPVGQKKPNGWDLYDMHGNVWEMCSDWYENDYYSRSPLRDPSGPTRGYNRVVRGGGANNDVQRLRCAHRTTSSQYDIYYLGLRLVRTTD